MLQTMQDPALRAFELLCENFGTPYSWKALNLLKNQRYVELSKLDITPGEYTSIQTFMQDYCIYSYLRKYQGFPGADEEQLKMDAKLKFENLERQNRETNIRLRHGTRKGVEGIISDAKRKIFRVLGEFSFDKVLPYCEWTTGATASLRKSSSFVASKMLENRISVSESCLPYLEAYLQLDPNWVEARLAAGLPQHGDPWTILNYSVLDSVYKTITTRRTIQKQPTANLFFQKGLGGYLRRRLKRFGVNLDDQGRNQELARKAYELGLATIDLSSASDRITWILVQLLLPPDWYTYADNTRTRLLKYGDGDIRWVEQFSSMGNGFTFELESLIFWALASSVLDEIQPEQRQLAVYGDDIILNSAASQRLIEVFEEVGFEVNVQKTFTKGPFYESCGKHYFKGRDVTPVYQKESLKTLPGYGVNVMRAANRLLDFSVRLGSMLFCHTDIKPAHEHLLFTLTRHFAELNTKRSHAARRGRRVFKSISVPYGPMMDGEGWVKLPLYETKHDRDGIFSLSYVREVPYTANDNDACQLAIRYRKRFFHSASSLQEDIRLYGLSFLVRRRRATRDELSEFARKTSAIPDSAPYDGTLSLDATREVLNSRRCYVGEVRFNGLSWS